jgi:hypothetical protein
MRTLDEATGAYGTSIKHWWPPADNSSAIIGIYTGARPVPQGSTRRIGAGSGFSPQPRPDIDDV